MPTILITGGHGGIGLEAAKRLASDERVDLLLAGRSTERMEPAAAALRAGGATIRLVQLDTSSLGSVRASAARVRAMLDAGEIDSLQAILCNAGAQFRGPVSYSTDGYEETFATNYLGHFLLVQLLLDCLVDHGRVVFTASGTHNPDTPDGKFVGVAAAPDAPALAADGKTGKPMSGGVRYTTSKLCMILFAYELQRRLRQSGSRIQAIAFDPGSIPGTGLLRTLPKPAVMLIKSSLMRWVFGRLGVTRGSLDFSGASLARIAADPAFASAGGKYFQSNDGRLNERRSSKASYDEAAASTLWRGSERLAHLQAEERPRLLPAEHG